MTLVHVTSAGHCASLVMADGRFRTPIHPTKGCHAD
jgi:hypothetical protein